MRRAHAAGGPRRGASATTAGRVLTRCASGARGDERGAAGRRRAPGTRLGSRGPYETGPDGFRLAVRVRATTVKMALRIARSEVPHLGAYLCRTGCRSLRMRVEPAGGGARRAVVPER